MANAKIAASLFQIVTVPAMPNRSVSVQSILRCAACAINTAAASFVPSRKAAFAFTPDWAAAKSGVAVAPRNIFGTIVPLQ